MENHTKIRLFPHFLILSFSAITKSTPFGVLFVMLNEEI